MRRRKRAEGGDAKFKSHGCSDRSVQLGNGCERGPEVPGAIQRRLTLEVLRRMASAVEDIHQAPQVFTVVDAGEEKRLEEELAIKETERSEVTNSRDQELAERDRSEKWKPGNYARPWQIVCVGTGLLFITVATWGNAASFVVENLPQAGDAWIAALLFSAPLPVMGLTLERVLVSVFPFEERRCRALILAVLACSGFCYIGSLAFHFAYMEDLDLAGDSMVLDFDTESVESVETSSSGFGASRTSLKFLFLAQVCSEVAISLTLGAWLSQLLRPQLNPQWEARSVAIEKTNQRISRLGETIMKLKGRLAELRARKQAYGEAKSMLGHLTELFH